ncbi:hypothetical protein WR25_01385 [Diploscapter pachys]|uniref:Uncharacterized protein n=1 Tax=Diploscapter pachys TaxID=2018661 RepID=A0A2A2LM25_9BILA|nr:hypothetical protein WR25_01385 [Diploscapter pachys]
MNFRFCFKRYSELKRELNRRRELRGTRFTRPSHFLLHSLNDLQESQQHMSSSNQKPPPTYQQCTSPNALPSYDEVAKLLRPQRPFSRYLHIL